MAAVVSTASMRPSTVSFGLPRDAIRPPFNPPEWPLGAESEFESRWPPLGYVKGNPKKEPLFNLRVTLPSMRISSASHSDTPARGSAFSAPPASASCLVRFFSRRECGSCRTEGIASVLVLGGIPAHPFPAKRFNRSAGAMTCTVLPTNPAGSRVTMTSSPAAAAHATCKPSSKSLPPNTAAACSSVAPTEMR